MSLLTEWREKAYSQENNQKSSELFWVNYFNIERSIYEQLLDEPNKVVEGSVKELAEKYGTELHIFVGFLDGINESLKNPNPIDDMEEDTKIVIDIDYPKLYKNMVAANADWLYELTQWDNILSKEEQKKFYLEQKKSNTIVKGKKVGRNDLCPCGSGKKYKYCCGR